MKIFVLLKGGEISSSGYTSLIDACNVFGCNYERARRGKRQFNGGKQLLEIEVIKSKRSNNSNNLNIYVNKLLTKKIEDIKAGVPQDDIEITRMHKWRDDITMEET